MILNSFIQYNQGGAISSPSGFYTYPHKLNIFFIIYLFTYTSSSRILMTFGSKYKVYKEK